MSRILGAVLAGGASSRFGSDKALAMVAGRSLLDHAAAALVRWTDKVVVVGREVPDRPVPGLGPLGGIAGALDHAARHGYAGVMTIGCDMPMVPEALLAAIRAAVPSYCADAPVLGHWPAILAATLIARLSEPDVRGPVLSVRRWAAAIGAVAIPAPGPLANVNTRADLPAA